MLAREETSQGLSTTHAILTAELILGLCKAIRESVSSLILIVLIYFFRNILKKRHPGRRRADV